MLLLFIFLTIWKYIGIYGNLFYYYTIGINKFSYDLWKIYLILKALLVAFMCIELLYLFYIIYV